LIFGTWRRRAVFTNGNLADSVFSVFSKHPATLAAVLMPDHVHWVVSSGDDLARLVGCTKSISTRISWRFGSRGKLWQRSFYDHVIRSEDELRVTIEYVRNNPIRSGLVADIDDYPWSTVSDPFL